jgi:hypothetical protein
MRRCHCNGSGEHGGGDDQQHPAHRTTSWRV